jgi:hypothetical protein
MFVHVFFVDIVSLSDSALGTREEQIEKINTLTKFITGSKFFQNAKNRIYFPTGDGAAVCFQEGPNWPLELALDIHKKISLFNKNKSYKKRLLIRIGISSGSIAPTRDLGSKENYWGLGLIYAKRIMDIGDANHILMDMPPARDLMETSAYFKKIIHYLGVKEIKHDAQLHVYSIYGSGFGNNKKPNAMTSSVISESEYGRLILNAVSGSQKQIMEKLNKLRKKYEITKSQIEKPSKRRAK